ncbi:hypothetical protein I0C86_27085 [Plantactinospora sp. S1510]|uniref:Uncharacterized protein n=1 Tax=Plantactinospora alkalitolerans TaxID=2789879 RepID=A0ABS0H2B2_9ACTN|nr:hypothetical protein [Plantactinospora alkalitolerans]MBF9132589.1 hypothetical protein [Plantactinospora alkalitolerans]
MVEPSISTVTGQLKLGQLVEPVPVPLPGSRQHHHQLRSGGWFVGLEYGDEHVRRWEAHAERARARRAGERA